LELASGHPRTKAQTSNKKKGETKHMPKQQTIRRAFHE